MKINKYSFLKLVLFTASIFLVIVLIIEFLYSLTTKETVTEITNNMKTPMYIIKKIVSSLIYGIIMAYFMKRKAKEVKK
jgi:uncharacterized membrane protein